MTPTAVGLPPEPIDLLLQVVSFETWFAPALAFVAGLALTLSPISWPSIPAVMTVLTPAARAGTVDGLQPEWATSASRCRVADRRWWSSAS